MQLSFRKATTADLDTINQLATNIWREHYPSVISNEQIDYMLTTRYAPEKIKEGMQQGEEFFLAFVDSQPVAYASVQLVSNSYFMHKFYVNVGDHRSGIGSAFFNYILQQINTGVPMRLQVNRQNIKAINFYFKMGFAIESTGDFDIGNGYYMNDFVMLRKN